MYEIISKKRNEILTKNTLAVKKVAAKNLPIKRYEIKMGGQELKKGLA